LIEKRHQITYSYNESTNEVHMIFRNIACVLLFLSVIEPVYAVPSLLPLASIIVVLAAKGALLLGSFFFFVLSLYKENKKKFLILGVTLFLLFILLMIFFQYG